MTTDWPETPPSDILRLRTGDPEKARAALRKILELYYAPICNYMKRNAPAGEAEDWAHDFVIKVADNHVMAKWAPEKGKLRHYVAAAMRRFITDKFRAAQRDPVRVGLPTTILLRAPEAEMDFHRQWALVLVGRALRRLREKAKGDCRWRDEVRMLALRYGLDDEQAQPASYEQIAGSFGRILKTSEIDNALRKTKRAFVEALRQEVRLLLESEDGITLELWNISELL